MARTASIGGEVIVKAGQIFKAKGLRGHRFVRVETVHTATGRVPYVDLREVTESGDYKTGRSWSGIPRSATFQSTLTTNGDGRWRMQPAYVEHS